MIKKNNVIINIFIFFVDYLLVFDGEIVINCRRSGKFLWNFWSSWVY